MSVERRTPLSPFFRFSSMNSEIYSGDFSLRLMKVSKAWPKGLPDELFQVRMCSTSFSPLSRSRSLWNALLHIVSNLSLRSSTSCTHFSASASVCEAGLGGRAFALPLAFADGSAAASSSCDSAPSPLSPVLASLISLPRRMTVSLKDFRRQGRPAVTRVNSRYRRAKSSSRSESIMASRPELGMLTTVHRWGETRFFSSIRCRGRVVNVDRM